MISSNFITIISYTMIELTILTIFYIFYENQVHKSIISMHLNKLMYVEALYFHYLGIESIMANTLNDHSIDIIMS